MLDQNFISSWLEHPPCSLLGPAEDLINPIQSSFLGFGFHSPKLRNPLQASYFYFCFLIFFSLLGSDYFSIKLTNSLQSLHFFLFESNWNRSMFYCFSDLTSGFFYFSLKLTNPLQSLHSFLFELK